MKYLVYLFFFTLSLQGCQSQNKTLHSAVDDTFSNYWFNGKAEITSYELSQARYGEIHKGEAVLIFVKEDFSKSKQVKLDNPSDTQEDGVPVLKLNMTKKFYTGIYPYSMMSSVFTPINIEKKPTSLKLTTSNQEWCGHTFFQLNKNNDDFDYISRSYFESEGDENGEIKVETLEDELWNIIRINPNLLPKGKTELIPSTMYLKLMHKELKAYNVLISKKEEGGLVNYFIKYPELDRSIRIFFKKEFPYEIERWQETYTSGFGDNSKTLITKAEKKARILDDYWNHNAVKDSTFKQKLK